ncbi:MAG: HAMP domain-containing histidine kinase [Planctomycetes bacterium]|nr:HAMP domain-containing histidine kinase [Planctomycetota bacterium]
MRSQFPKGTWTQKPGNSKAIGRQNGVFERKSLKWPILVAILMIVMLVGLTVGWVLLNVFSALDAEKASRSSIYWVLLGVGAVLFAFLLAGVILYLIWIIQNINLNRRQSNFIDAVTHELKTPIASLKLYLQTLHRRDVQGPQRQQFYSTMMEDVERLDRLINQLLDVARLQRDQQDPASKEWVSLRSVTQECIERLAKQHSLSLEVFEVSIQDCQVLAHRIDIDVLLGNLLDNAIKYSSAEPYVEVRITFQNQSALIAISDNGPGIPRHLRRKIFSRFYRAGDELERRKPGVGLGLFLVRSIVERLKGSITVSERIKHPGATFLVTLPAQQS